MAEARHYRLFEVDHHGRGIELPTIYTDLQAAIDDADWIIAKLIGKPHRRPQYVNVFDVWTGEIMAKRKPDQPTDDGLCALCGQPRDPFAPAPASNPASLPDAGAGQP